MKGYEKLKIRFYKCWMLRASNNNSGKNSKCSPTSKKLKIYLNFVKKCNNKPLFVTTKHPLYCEQKVAQTFIYGYYCEQFLEYIKDYT